MISRKSSQLFMKMLHGVSRRSSQFVHVNVT
jgi:hypothetical protein